MVVVHPLRTIAASVIVNIINISVFFFRDIVKPHKQYYGFLYYKAFIQQALYLKEYKKKVIIA